MKKALATMGFVATLATPAFVEADTIYYADDYRRQQEAFNHAREERKKEEAEIERHNQEVRKHNSRTLPAALEWQGNVADCVAFNKTVDLHSKIYGLAVSSATPEERCSKIYGTSFEEYLAVGEEQRKRQRKEEEAEQRWLRIQQAEHEWRQLQEEEEYKAWLKSIQNRKASPAPKQTASPVNDYSECKPHGIVVPGPERIKADAELRECRRLATKTGENSFTLD